MSHLKYFSILIKIDKEHRYFIGPGQSISLINMCQNNYSWKYKKLSFGRLVLGM